VGGKRVHEVDRNALEALVDRLLALSPRPTGLFAWADMLTAALYPCLHRRGLQPGREISVVSCNNEWPLLFGLWPRPAVVDIQGAKVGRRAVEQLLWRIPNRREPRAVLLLEPALKAPSPG
jgi:LacI family transcriptional regulator